MTMKISTKTESILSLMFAKDEEFRLGRKTFNPPKHVVNRVVVCQKCNHAYEVKEVEGYMKPNQLECPKCGVINWEELKTKFEGRNVFIYINWEYYMAFSPRIEKIV